MQNVLLTIHLIACLALVIAVMLQRSEGGALGMSGGGTGGLISGRGAAGVLVRTTMILAGVFFVTSVVMTRLNNNSSSEPSLLERQTNETTDPFDTLTQKPATTAPDALGGVTVPAPATPAEATVPAGATPAPAPVTTPDPLAPKTTPATPAATPPAATAPATSVPATTAPTTPAKPPENGGSPTP